jgi:hypothetical protein
MSSTQIYHARNTLIDGGALRARAAISFDFLAWIICIPFFLHSFVLNAGELHYGLFLPTPFVPTPCGFS